MMRWALGIEYDGTHYCGWQAQPDLRTVEGDLSLAISLVADHEIELVCGGRTDSGVHASGQIVHFDTSSRRSMHAWTMGANANLGPHVSVAWARPVADYFHARYSALRRHYRYTIFNRRARSALAAARSAWVGVPLDVEAMQMAATPLIGEHDFSAFRAAECQSNSPVRRLDAIVVTRSENFIHIDVTANAFLHHMVRNIAGLLMSVGRGERSVAHVADILASRDRRRNAATAPAEGLCLVAIDYPAAFRLPGRSGIITHP